MSNIAISVNGTRIGLPEASLMTKYYLEEAKTAENLEGIEKHYKATAYMLLATAASFFNSLAYGASAIFESALIAPLDREAAKKNFDEQGLRALDSLAYFAAGVFMTLGCLIMPDQVLAQIHILPAGPGGGERDEEGERDAGVRDRHPHPVPVEDEDGLELFHELEEARLMISGALGRISQEGDVPIPALVQKTFQEIFANGRQPTDEDLPIMKALLAQIVFFNDLEGKPEYRDVIAYIETELGEVKLNMQEEKAEHKRELALARDAALARLEEDREILAEQNAASKKLDQEHVFAQEKGKWQALIGRSTEYRAQLNAQVEALAIYTRLIDSVKGKSRFGGAGRDLRHWINTSKAQVGEPGVIPEVTAREVTQEERNAIAVEHLESDYSELTTVEAERRPLHHQLDTLAREIEELKERLVVLNQAKVKWEGILAYADTLGDTDAVDKGQL
ncbi:MAG: hypothetical protein AB7N99_07180 [Simkaniaceae bacterium]